MQTNLKQFHKMETTEKQTEKTEKNDVLNGEEQSNFLELETQENPKEIENEIVERLEFGGCFELIVNRTTKEHIYTIKGETSGFLFDQEKRKNGAKIGNFLRNKQ